MEEHGRHSKRQKMTIITGFHDHQAHSHASNNQDKQCGLRHYHDPGAMQGRFIDILIT